MTRAAPWLLAFHAVTGLAFVLSEAPGTAAALDGLPLDDAWIHLVYARALAHGQGFSYNPGTPEAGCTSPLWALLEVPSVWVADAIHTTPVVGVKITGVMLAWVLSLTMLGLALRLRLPPAAALVAAVLPAVDPSLTFAKVSGMEVVLASLLPLLALERMLAGRLGLAALALGLAPLARPETAPFVALAAGVLARRWWLGPRDARRASGLATALVLPGAAWVGWCLWATGRPLPSTFYAKFRAGGELGDNLVTVFGPMLAGLPYFFAGAGLVLFGLGVRRLMRAGSDRDVRSLLCALPIVLMLAIAWAHVLQQSWPFYWNRYFQPAIAGLLLVLVAGATSLIAWARGDAGKLSARPTRVAIVASVLLLSLYTLPGRFAHARELYAWNCQNIEEVQVALGRWLHDHVAPGQWIAVNDAGALRYFSERPTVDMVGLNDHRVQRDGLMTRLAETEPRLYVVFPTWYPAVLQDRRFSPVHSATSSNYTICDCPQEEMVVYERSDSRTRTPPIDR